MTDSFSKLVVNGGFVAGATGSLRYDELHGRRLMGGERVRIRWPDKSESEHVINIEHTSGTYPVVGGGFGRWDDHRAVVTIDYRGVPATIVLRGLKILATFHDSGDQPAR